MRKGLLPPLNSLVAFEAAARYGSFTMAARELSVTQGAISRQVHLLEQHLGTPLFARTNRAVELTAIGATYADSVRLALQNLSEATHNVSSWSGAQQVTVATSNAMASLWLLPRIAEFKREYPDIEIHILAIEQIGDLRRFNWDFALYYSSQPPSDYNGHKLFDEEVFPVCSPAYAGTDVAPNTLSTPDALRHCTLLYLDVINRDWLSWQQWFESMGLQEITPRNRISINNYSMLIQAAIMGQGVALGWSQLVDHHLHDGSLIRPMPDVLQTSSCFYMLESPARPVRQLGAQVLRQWLTEAIPPEIGKLGRADADTPLPQTDSDTQR